GAHGRTGDRGRARARSTARRAVRREDGGRPAPPRQGNGRRHMRRRAQGPGRDPALAGQGRARQGFAAGEQAMIRIPLLTTEGDAYACGLAHGRRFAREIADNLATYLRRFAASGLDRDAAFTEAARWRKAIAAHNGGYAHGARRNRASCASPRPASPAEKWASTNAGSAWSKTVSPRVTMAAIRTKTRFMCAAARCWMRSASMTRCGR